MKTRSVNAENLQPGMMLWAWTKEARGQQGKFQHLQDGPTGCWQAMVVANVIADPSVVEGFGYPSVHQIDVMFWNDNEQRRFHSFFWTAGTQTPVIE